MKQISEFSQAEQIKMAADLRNNARANRRLAAFRGLTKKQAQAYLARAAESDTAAAEWEAAAGADQPVADQGPL